MNCINCRHPHNDNYITVLGMFKLCQSCEDAGKRLGQLLKQGIEIEFVDLMTDNKSTSTFRS